MAYKRQIKSKQDKQKEAQQSIKRKQITKTKPVKKSIKFKPLEARGLNEKQMLLCQEYIIDLSIEKAADRTGYVAAHARRIITENRNAIRYINHLKVKRAERNQVTADRVLQELARIAYHDHRTFYDKDGMPIPLDLITDDQQTAIRDIQWKEYIVLDQDGKPVLTEDGQKEVKRIIKKYSLYNRVDALKMLGHHLGMHLDKPADKITQVEKEQAEITFEQLLRRLKAPQLEQLTQWLLDAAKPIEPGIKDINEDIENDPSKESTHWSNKTLGGVQ